MVKDITYLNVGAACNGRETAFSERFQAECRKGQRSIRKPPYGIVDLYSLASHTLQSQEKEINNNNNNNLCFTVTFKTTDSNAMNDKKRVVR